MKPGDVVEIKRRVLRDQLGGLLTGEEGVPAPATFGYETQGARGRGASSAGPRDADAPQERGRKPRHGKADGDAPRAPRDSRGDAGDRPRSFGARPDGDRKPRPPRAEGDRPERGAKPFGDRKPRADGDRPARGDKPYSDKPRSFGARPMATASRAPLGPRATGRNVAQSPLVIASRVPMATALPEATSPLGANRAATGPRATSRAALRASPGGRGGAGGAEGDSGGKPRSGFGGKPRAGGTGAGPRGEAKPRGPRPGGGPRGPKPGGTKPGGGGRG